MLLDIFGCWVRKFAVLALAPVLMTGMSWADHNSRGTKSAPPAAAIMRTIDGRLEVFLPPCLQFFAADDHFILGSANGDIVWDVAAVSDTVVPVVQLGVTPAQMQVVTPPQISAQDQVLRIAVKRHGTIDLVIFHIASLFPGTAELHDKRVSLRRLPDKLTDECDRKDAGKP